MRRRLGVRTLFNCLGPLANPAGAAYQLLGVGRPELLDPLAGALSLLGVRHALLVCGRDGLDEVSLAGPTLVREVRGHQVVAWEWTPEDFGLERCAAEELRADGPERECRDRSAPCWRARTARRGASCWPTPPRRCWRPTGWRRRAKASPWRRGGP